MPLTNEEVDAQHTIFAIMLAEPYLNGDYGELAVNVRDDIQAILWEFGYVPAQRLLLESGASPEQVERSFIAKKCMFHIGEA